MEPPNIRKVSYEELVYYTDNFCQSNYIGHFQFGKLYRGKLYRGKVKHVFSPEDVMVKIWEVPEIYNYKPGDNERRLSKEIILLRHEMLINHPGMVKLYEYCWEGDRLGVVYEFKPFDSLFNLIPKDGFTWLQRIKAALGLASLLKFLHARNSSFYKPFIVHNLDAAHIVLDEEYNPKLCDFGLITGGIFSERITYSSNHVGCYGYVDIGSSNTDKKDVFAFGVILLSLISKRVYTEEDRLAGVPFVFEWALREYEAFESDSNMKNTEFSLVHESLAAEDGFHPADGHKITKLALQCVNGVEGERPNMKQVYRFMRKLEVVKQHADFLGVNKVLRACENGR